MSQRISAGKLLTIPQVIRPMGFRLLAAHDNGNATRMVWDYQGVYVATTLHESSNDRVDAELENGNIVKVLQQWLEKNYGK